MKKLKVGLIVDSKIVSKQVDHLFQMSLKSDLYDISLVRYQSLKSITIFFD